MEFTWSWVMVLTLVLWLLALVVALALVGLFVPDEKFMTETSLARPSFVVSTIIVFVLIVGGMQAIGYAITGDQTVYRSGSTTASAVAKEFGLVSGQAYPMAIGDRSGTPGATIYPGSFWTNATITLRPGSTISVSYDWRDTTGLHSQILELPMANIVFNQQSVAEPQVTLYLRNGYVADYGETITTPGPCHQRIESLWLIHDCTSTSTVQLTASALQRGPSDIISRFFDNAVIDLTPAQYNQLLGKI